jgi:hypothetical protein
MLNYLYNGIKLPALPSVDKSTFPYATIIPIYELSGFQYVFSGKYGLRSTASPIFYRNSAGYINVNDINADLRVIYYEFDGTEWVGDGSVKELSTAFSANDVTWSNYDILNADGSVYLPASDPVPVGETPEAFSSYVHNGTWQKGTFYKRVNNAWVKHQAYKRQNGAWVKVKE